jgi:transposase
MPRVHKNLVAEKYRLKVQQEVVDVLRGTRYTFREVAAFFDTSIGQVQGINFRYKVRPIKAYKLKPTPAQFDEAELQAEESRLRARLVAIAKERAALQIHVAVEGDEIVIHGMGHNMVRAHWRSWLRLLKQNGALRIREEIGKNFTDKNLRRN